MNISRISWVVLLFLLSCFSSSAKDYLADKNNLQDCLSKVKPGDTIIVSGRHTNFSRNKFFNFKYLKEGTRKGFQTVVSGTEDKPIRIIGDGTALIDGGGLDSHIFGLSIIHDHYIIENLIIKNIKKGFLAEASKYGFVKNVRVENCDDEAFKFRYGAQYWKLVDCVAKNTGLLDHAKKQGIGKRNGEGFYVGNAKSNWKGQSLDSPDRSGYIEFINCIAIDTRNDGFDFKEGAHHIKCVNCKVDWTSGNEPMPNADQGDSGFYVRANNVQLIDCLVEGANHYNAAVKFVGFALNGEYFGGNLDVKGMSIKNFSENSGMYHVKTAHGRIRSFDDYKLNGSNKYAVMMYGGNKDSHKSPEYDVKDLPVEAFQELSW